MDTKRLMGMMNAPAHKRYKSFCTQAADTEEVWLMQDAPELSLEPLPRPEEIGLRTARNYDMMQRVSETTSAKRAEMRRLLTVVQGRFQSGDQATRNHYRDLELRLKEALRML